MAKYRKKPVEIEAVQWSGENLLEVSEFTGGKAALGREVTVCSDGSRMVDSEACLAVETLEGRMRADIGDFIIKGVVGEFYPCKAEIFAETYEAV